MSSKAHWGYSRTQLEEWRSLLEISAEFVSACPTFLCEVDGQVIGFYSLVASGEAWELNNLWVLPRFMRKGLGLELFSHAMQTATMGGARVIAIDSDPNAEAFYVSRGAKRVGTVAAPITGQPDRIRPQLELHLTRSGKRALTNLVERIREWGVELGFARVGISDVNVERAAVRLDAWLSEGRHGDMDYMQHHSTLRADPSRLLPGALRVIAARMDYLPRDTPDDWAQREFDRLNEADTAVVSIYARGRDYHKILRDRLQELASRIEAQVGQLGYRVATDSAPVLEVELARKAGLGWRGKHTLLLSQDAGSMFFLGEILTDLPLPIDQPIGDHCGTCSRCIDICPTQAITAPYQLDARRCISYLTIEHRGSIPFELRPLIGNRVYGCDDCQLVCPWNKFARTAGLPDFDVRNGLDCATLIELFGWDETQFNERHAGSAIRRIGHERWLRNIAVALGNAPTTPEVIAALQARAEHSSELVREHVAWALVQHTTHQAA